MSIKKLTDANINCYESIKKPMFLCNSDCILWHNVAAEELMTKKTFREFILKLDPDNKGIGAFICDGVYYKLLVRPCENGRYIEVTENQNLNTTLESSTFIGNAEMLDNISRRESHKIFNSIHSIGIDLEKAGLYDDLKKLDQIADGAHSILRASNLCHEYSLLMQGKMNYEIVDMFLEIDVLCSSVNSIMRRSNVRFNWKVPKEKLFCYLDINKFVFAVFNLICNSYYFTAQGNEIEVVLNRLDGNLVRLDVMDKGVGISPELLDKVVEPFFSYNKATGDVAGCGLGLTYVNAFVEKLGGTLNITSKPGDTCVSITVPVQDLDCMSLNSGVARYGVNKYEYIVSTMADFAFLR